MKVSQPAELGVRDGQRFFPAIDFKTRFPALDGIRALAVTLVFAYHYGGGAHSGGAGRILNQVRQQGWAGVHLFFALSGFLITGILYDTRRDSRYLMRFWARRSLRIFPVFYLLAAVALLLTPIFQYRWTVGHLPFLVYMGNFWTAFHRSSLYVQSPTHPAASLYLGHLWTLCVEEQFYLIWPVAVWMVRDRVRLIQLATALSAAALFFRIAMNLLVAPAVFEGWGSQLPFNLDALLMGAILALVLRGPAADRWQRSCRWIFLGSIALLAAGLAVHSRPGWTGCIGLTLIATASTGLIGSTLRPASPAFRLFSLRPLRVLGKYSYGFYLYHLVWASAWWYLAKSLGDRLHSSSAGLLLMDLTNFAVTLLVAKISYDLYESRFLKLKGRFEYDSELREHKHAFVAR